MSTSVGTVASGIRCKSTGGFRSLKLSHDACSHPGDDRASKARPVAGRAFAGGGMARYWCDGGAAYGIAARGETDAGGFGGAPPGVGAFPAGVGLAAVGNHVPSDRRP